MKFQNLPPFHAMPHNVPRWQFANNNPDNQWNIQLIKLTKMEQSDLLKWYHYLSWLPCQNELLSLWCRPCNTAIVAQNLNVEKLISNLNHHHNSLGYRDRFESFCMNVSHVKGYSTISLKWVEVIASLPAAWAQSHKFGVWDHPPILGTKLDLLHWQVG